MFAFPVDCDPLVFQFLNLDALLATRQCSRAALRRYDPRLAKLTWAAVRPSMGEFVIRFTHAPPSFAMFLSAAYDFTTADVRMAVLFVNTCCVATRRDVGILEQIATRYALTLDDARMYDNYILRNVRELKVVQWLADRFSLTTTDARSQGNSAVQSACERGHLHMAQWLVARFELTATDARDAHNRCLRNACFGGHLELAQWLTTRFEITTTDVRACNNNALYHACRQGHLAVVQWLVEHFKLEWSDVRDGLSWTKHERPRTPAAADTVRWLESHL